MKSLYKFSKLLALCLVFSTCEKYEQGGTLASNRRHLFGEKKDGASKTWKLKLYEVNGIDSTFLISGISQIPNFHEKHITFILDNKKGYSGKGATFLFNYDISLGFSPSKEINIVYDSSPPTATDSSQCNLNKTICSRNLFIPEGPGKSGLWQIKKLTKKEFIIENNKLKNLYKIILTQ